MADWQRLQAGQTDGGAITAQAPARAAPPNIANLQSLRAFCALAIVLFHSVETVQGYGFDAPLLMALRGWGFQGVDIFFLISGFVMVLTQAHKQRSRGAFLIERIVRVAPTYWLLTGLVFALTLAVPALFRSLSADPFWFLQSISFTTLLWTGGKTFPLIYVGWTLEYELLFYLAFAASLGLTGWWRRLACHAALFALLWPLVRSTILFEFLLGELCALHYLSGRTIGQPRLLLLLGLIGLALPVLLWPDHHRHMTSLRVLLFGMPAIGLILWALHARQTRNRLLLMIGDASYSIYLIQALGISFFCKLIARLAPAMPPTLVLAAVVIGTTLLGLLFFYSVERPMVRGLKKRIATPCVDRAAIQSLR